MKRLMIIAGEASGDVHGAGIVREFKKQFPAAELFGIGGDKMIRAGFKAIFHVREMSFMGFVEVIKHLPLIRSVEKTLTQLLRIMKPDAVLLIDYPGFNLRFARIVKKFGIKVFYYISPQVWAWKKKRVKKMKTVIDEMFCVFPFEVPIYEHEQIPVKFVGHPLMEEIEPPISRENFCKRNALDPQKEIIALIPGSRKQEIENLFSVMVRSAMELSGGRSNEIVVAAAPNMPLELYQNYLPPNARVTFVQHAAHEVMAHAKFAFVTSGTATLETAILGTPMIVVYRTSWLTYAIARFIVKIEHISLVNIVAGKKIVPELIQYNAVVSKLVSTAKEILVPETYNTMKAELNELTKKLGRAGASKNVVDAIVAAV
ncbi:MAG: lipid-A-disaccharide synthase [Bacteroidetes bacterium]|nr:lipid-A-disaccharide synthase [Bacteroidota bacterium]